MPNYQFFGSYTREWQVSQGVVKFQYNFQTRKAKCLYKADNCVHEILLHDIVGIPSLVLEDQVKLIKFLDNTYVKPTLCSDGSYKLYVNGRLHGGGNIELNVETLWPNAIVPITVDCNSFNNSENELATILEAVNEWAKHTNFKFVVYLQSLDPSLIRLTDNTSEKLNIIFPSKTGFIELRGKNEFTTEAPPSFSNYVLLQKYTPQCAVLPHRETVDSCNVCQSPVGRQSTEVQPKGVQLISCKLGESFNKGSIMHEIGHALGLYHEHQRPYRDNFIQLTKLMPAQPLETRQQWQANYGIIGNIIGPYDFDSIMHYPVNAQLTDGQTILLHPNTAKTDTIPQHVYTGTNIGQHAILSDGDIAAANKLAALACDPNTFKKYASQQQQSGNSNKAIQYYMIANDVSLQQYRTADWSCYYQIVIEQIKLGELDNAKANLNNIIRNTNVRDQWYERSTSKLSEIVQSKQPQMTQQFRGIHFTPSAPGRY